MELLGIYFEIVIRKTDILEFCQKFSWRKTEILS